MSKGILLSPAAKALRASAYDHVKNGHLGEAARLFSDAIGNQPGDPNLHYMLGLAHKYLGNWRESLAANLRALELYSDPEDAEGAVWNAAIAATSVGDWNNARKLWKRCGIDLPPGEGPIEVDFGTVSIRLNAWSSGETLWAQRIDPVRTRLLSVPFPESGYFHGDIVLHDGAITGQRTLNGNSVPVFNALDRLVRSDTPTFTVFVDITDEKISTALTDMTGPGIAHVEDWTASVRPLCLRCSYGEPHLHGEPKPDAEWNPERTIGIAAQSRSAVDGLVRQWRSRFPGVSVTSIHAREHPIPDRMEGSTWWKSDSAESDD